MADSSDKREEEIRSALQRLPLAVVVVEGGKNLRPYNAKGTEFFEREVLAADMLKSRPSHPLSHFIRGILEDQSSEAVNEAVVEMPSGNVYRIELSRRSEKGPSRLLMLLVQSYSRGATPRLEKWGFTSREHEVVQHLLSGASSSEICERIHVSPQTVKSHIASLLEKTSCRTRTELVAKLLRD